MKYGMSKGTGAERLRDWMTKKGMTQKAFAELVGAHQTSVSTWLQGRPPTVAMALRIRDATTIPVDCWGPIDFSRKSA